MKKQYYKLLVCHRLYWYDDDNEINYKCLSLCHVTVIIN